jgi:hypothetical protein
VFAHFAETGDACRLYLLKIRTIGRMLDVFLYGYPGNKEKPHITDKLRNKILEKIPLFQLEKDLYMHSNLEKQEFKMSNLERKQILVDATP